MLISPVVPKLRVILWEIKVLRTKLFFLESSFCEILGYFTSIQQLSKWNYMRSLEGKFLLTTHNVWNITKRRCFSVVTKWKVNKQYAVFYKLISYYYIILRGIFGCQINKVKNNVSSENENQPLKCVAVTDVVIVHIVQKYTWHKDI